MTFDRIERLTQMVQPLAASLGLVLWGVEVVGASRPVARIYVDADPDRPRELTEGADAPGEAEEDLVGGTGVTVDECAHLSRLLGLTLDVEEPFASNWVLEISSPGLERPFFRFEQLRGYEGRTLDVLMSESHDEWNGRKKFCGRLDAVGDETLTLTPSARTVDDPDDVCIPWHLVRRAHLVHEFAESGRKAEKPGAKKPGGKKPARKQPKAGDALE